MTTHFDVAQRAIEISQKAIKEWFSYQDSFELEMALRAIGVFKPKIVLEIGIANGASLASWAEMVQPELTIGIDPLTNPKTPEQQESFNNLLKRYNIHLIPHVSCIPEAHKELERILNGRKVDFMFIDADHRYDSVRHDYYNYVKYLNKPAIVGLHDIYYSEQIFDSGSQVSVLWNRLKNQYSYDEFYFHSSMGIGLIYI